MTGPARLCDTIGAVALILAIVGCSSSAATDASPADTPQPGASASASPSPAVAGAALVVLAGATGGGEIWRYDAAGWVDVGGAGTATTIAAAPDGFVLVGATSIDRRSLAAPAQTSSTVAISWPSGATAPSVSSVAVSSGGDVALATGTDTPYGLWRVDSSGRANSMSGAPAQSFSPSLAWLDATRLLVLSTDNQQASRIATLDVASGKLEALAGPIGVHWFALSGDGKTLAASTGDALYAAPTDDWLAGKSPSRVAMLGTDQVAWRLTLDSTGANLAALVGQVSDDGSIANARVVDYASGSGGWLKVFDVAAPAGSLEGEAWVG